MELMEKNAQGEYRIPVKETKSGVLVVEPRLLKDNKEYKLFCVAGASNDLYVGAVDRSISTFWFTEDFDFNVYNNDNSPVSSNKIKPYE